MVSWGLFSIVWECAIAATIYSVQSDVNMGYSFVKGTVARIAIPWFVFGTDYIMSGVLMISVSLFYNQFSVSMIIFWLGEDFI